MLSVVCSGTCPWNAGLSLVLEWKGYSGREKYTHTHTQNTAKPAAFSILADISTHLSAN